MDLTTQLVPGTSTRYFLKAQCYRAAAARSDTIEDRKRLLRMSKETLTLVLEMDPTMKYAYVEMDETLKDLGDMASAREWLRRLRATLLPGWTTTSRHVAGAANLITS